jgi:hypothetical protein
MTGDTWRGDETRPMSHREPSTTGTVFLVLLIAALTIPGIIVVAHDTLPRHLPWVEQQRSGD